MNPPQLLYALALQAVPHIGDITAKKLIQHCGSPKPFLKNPKQPFQKLKGLAHTPSSISMNQST